MKLFELKPSIGSTKARKRKGRGHGSGNGKTAGKGHKGQKARSGGGVRVGFEGGQMPLYRRIPKRGFTNIFAKEYTEVTLDKLDRLDAGSVVDAETLREKGIIRKIRKNGIVILGSGEITKNITVKAARVTEGAKQKIEAAGGKVEVI